MGSFGSNLKNIRKEMNLSQSNIAKQVGVGQTTIANYENDIRFPGPVILSKLCDILDVSFDALIGGEKYNVEPLEKLTIYNEKFMNLLLTYKDDEAIKLILNLAKRGHDVVQIYHVLLVETLYEVGNLWKTGEVSILMEHHVTNIIDKILILLSPYIELMPSNGKTSMFIVPSNETHLIGLKIVREMFKKYGWKTFYIGNSVPWGNLVTGIEKHQIDLVVISTTMIDNLNQTKAIVDFIHERTEAKVMLGGQAYISKEYILKEVNYDYYANSRSEIIDLLEKLNIE